MFKLAVPLTALLLAGPALSQPVTLTPADPQPDEDLLFPGLAVSYADASVRTLAEAETYLSEATPGTPLMGLSYLDTEEGEMALTATSPEKVVADINGYIKFDTAGTFGLEIFSNDGIDAHIGGQQVAFLDGVHGCESAGVTQVTVPVPGWYEVNATYFQRKGTSCLLMDWDTPGDMDPVPDAAFAYTE